MKFPVFFIETGDFPSHQIAFVFYSQYRSVF